MNIIRPKRIGANIVFEIPRELVFKMKLEADTKVIVKIIDYCQYSTEVIEHSRFKYVKFPPLAIQKVGIDMSTQFSVMGNNNTFILRKIESKSRAMREIINDMAKGKRPMFH